METEEKVQFMHRRIRSLQFACNHAVLPEDCGFGGRRTVLTVSRGNCSDHVTVVPLLPAGHYAPDETQQNGTHAFVTVDDQTYMALCDSPVTIPADSLDRFLGYVRPFKEYNGVLRGLASHFLITKGTLL